MSTECDGVNTSATVGSNMAKIFQFPVDPDKPFVPESREQVKQLAEGIKHIWIDEIVEAVMTTMAQQLTAAGFPVIEDVHKKHFGFLIETVRAACCQTQGMYHPILEVSEAIMEEIPVGEDMPTAFK